MKKMLFLAALLTATQGWAQDDDMYFVPSKQKAQKEERIQVVERTPHPDYRPTTQQTVTSGYQRSNSRDVDEYNRRGTTQAPVSDYQYDNSDDETTYVQSQLDAQSQSYISGYTDGYSDGFDDYSLSRRIIRYRRPGLVWYGDVMDVYYDPWFHTSYYYDPWYYSSWRWGYTSWGWAYPHYHYSWGYPYYGWQGHWHYAPPRPGVAHRPSGRTLRNGNSWIASRGGRRGSTVAGGGDRRTNPRTSSGTTGRTNVGQGRPGTTSSRRPATTSTQTRQPSTNTGSHSSSGTQRSSTFTPPSRSGGSYGGSRGGGGSSRSGGGGGRGRR